MNTAEIDTFTHRLHHFTQRGVAELDAETPVVVNDVTQGHALLHGEEKTVFADAGYQGATKRPEATGAHWHVAMRPGKRKQ